MDIYRVSGSLQDLSNESSINIASVMRETFFIIIIVKFEICLDSIYSNNNNDS